MTITRPFQAVRLSRTSSAVVTFLLVWTTCVAFLAATRGNFLFPIASMVLFGGVMSGVGMLLTRKTNAPAVPVVHPKRESIAVLAYLVFYTFILFGPVATAVKDAFGPGPTREFVVVGYKLIVHLVLPAILIVAIGGRLRGIFDAGLARRGVVAVLVLFSAVMIGLVAALNSIFETLAATGITHLQIVGWIALAWAWMAIEAGLCEEFLFRGLLQSRLNAWFGSAPWAIIAMCIVFALVHVPGFYLRGGENVAKQAQGLAQITALAIGAIGPIALMMGILWQRTRSFLLVVLVHGAIDAMPAVERMMRIWS